MKLTMIGRIGPCYLINYSVLAARVAHLLPPGLQLITHGDRAFLGVVLSRIDRMRPRHVPRALGMSYHHIAYRLYVKAELPDGSRISGLHFLRSDVDSRLMSLGGNVLTDFRFHPADITFGSDQMTVQSRDGCGDASVKIIGDCDDVLTSGSCFESMDECARVLTYQPNGLACDRNGLRVAQVIRDEARWRETPVRVEARFAFLDEIAPGAFHLERAMRVAPIEYIWRLNAGPSGMARSAPPSDR
jgi:hypothetical protein